jgi:rRNA biogenesis protein RRP5
VTEIDKAREVAERALKRIEARLSDEKLNLENTYGTPQSLTEVFQRACTYNDPKRVHLELIKIHTNSGNAEVSQDPILFQR